MQVKWRGSEAGIHSVTHGCVREIKLKRKNFATVLRLNGEGVRQEDTLSPWLFSMFMDGCIRE